MKAVLMVERMVERSDERMADLRAGMWVELMDYWLVVRMVGKMVDSLEPKMVV